jgi:ribA/ribD-fused uncharacterized protein
MIVPALNHLFAPTVEHAFQAWKAKDEAHIKWVLAANTPGQAKRRGRQVELRDDWLSIRVAVMDSLLRIKFKPLATGSPFAPPFNPLSVMLVATGDAELIEGNTWNDTFWGVCRGKGENHLGKLLMQIRKELVEMGVKP